MEYLVVHCERLEWSCDFLHLWGDLVIERGEGGGGVKDVLNARGLIVPGWAQGVMYTALCTLLYFVFEFVFEKIRFTEASFESMSFLPIF